MTAKANSSVLKTQECNNKRQALSQLKRKKWDVQFKTKAQSEFYKTIDDHTVTFCAGPAGTGKSFISLYYALKQLADKNNTIDGIILCRPLIPIDNESIGYLPGDVAEKVDPYMMAYWQNIEKLIGKMISRVLIDSEVIQVVPLAFFRGITLDNKVIIYDEAQNSTPTAMKSFLTRLGDSSKMIIMGDVNQSDRKGKSGLVDAIERLIELPEVGASEFKKSDIVRHNLISKILEKYEKDGDLNTALFELKEQYLTSIKPNGEYKNRTITTPDHMG